MKVFRFGKPTAVFIGAGEVNHVEVVVSADVVKLYKASL